MVSGKTLGAESSKIGTQMAKLELTIGGPTKELALAPTASAAFGSSKDFKDNVKFG